MSVSACQTGKDRRHRHTDLYGRGRCPLRGHGGSGRAMSYNIGNPALKSRMNGTAAPNAAFVLKDGESGPGSRSLGLQFCPPSPTADVIIAAAVKFEPEQT
jgi:hypothetical protein